MVQYLVLSVVLFRLVMVLKIQLLEHFPALLLVELSVRSTSNFSCCGDGSCWNDS